MYGLPTATTKLLALVMAVLKTLGLHRLLVGLLEYPDGSSDSVVLMKRALNSLPAIMVNDRIVNYNPCLPLNGGLNAYPVLGRWVKIELV